MFIATFTNFRRTVTAILFVPLLISLLHTPAFAAGGSGDDIRVEHPTVHTEGDTVRISYDLVAPAGYQYRVRLVLHRADDPSFTFIPTAVSGDVGDNVTAGNQKGIVWAYKYDFPRGLDGTNFTFVITAEKISSIPWLYYVAGAILAGGASAFLLLKKSNSHGPQSDGSQLPSPPTRPD